MTAGNPVFRNINAGANTGLFYNMLVYKAIIPDRLVDLATFGRDKTIKKEHIETAFASFPMFCGDPSETDDKFTSCKKDIAGFLFFLQLRDWTPVATTYQDIEFYQSGLSNVVDDVCYGIVLANSEKQDISHLTAA